MITKKNRPEKVWVSKGTEVAGEFNKLCKAEGTQSYSTMSETAFAERTIRSLKKKSTSTWKIMDTSKLTNCLNSKQPNSRKNCSIDLIPKNIKSSDLLSILYSKPLRDYRKPKFKIGDRVRNLKYELPFRKGYQPQFNQESFEIVASSFKKPSKYKTKYEQDDIIRGKFHQKN